MNLQNKLSVFASAFYLPNNQDFLENIKKALTHSSFYIDNPHSKEYRGNSRFVFTGMYVFKGHVAQLLSEQISGTGTQLQHYCGNLFKNQYLEELFDKFNFEGIIRFGGEFDWRKHKHIFVYAFLGLIHETYVDDKTQYQNFIHRFILKNKEHLFPGGIHNKDYKAQCHRLSLQYFGKKITINFQKTSAKLFESTFDFPETETIILSDANYIQLQNRSYKKLLQLLSEYGEQKTSTGITFYQKQIELQKQNIDIKIAEKEAKYKELEEKRAIQRESRKIKRDEIKKINKTKEKNKLKAKQAQKIRKDKYQDHDITLAKMKEKRNARKVRRSDK